MRRIAAALIVLGIAPVTAQQPSFKSTVELVTVPPAVTNVTRDKLITGGLTAADFRVFEDGVPREISLFSQDRRPTSLCIVVDASGSMARAHRHDMGVAALQHTVRGLEKGDEVAIVRFDERITTVAAADLTLLHEFRYRYTLAYTPATPMDGTYRRIKVEIAVTDLLVRHRGGYVALPSTSPKPLSP
jgi:hypothetical protein